MKCSTCGMLLNPVFPQDNDLEETLQLDNALILRVEGGYGMFTDDIEGAYPVFLLCHECAHLFCRIFDPNRKLIDPYQSHSHRDGSVPDSHEGWDREYRKP